MNCIEKILKTEELREGEEWDGRWTVHSVFLLHFSMKQDVLAEGAVKGGTG